MLIVFDVGSNKLTAEQFSIPRDLLKTYPQIPNLVRLPLTATSRENGSWSQLESKLPEIKASLMGRIILDLESLKRKETRENQNQ